MALDQATLGRMDTVLREIRTDIEEDARRLDGAPFTGATVAEALGHLGAATSALAGIMLVIVEEIRNEAGY